MDGLRKSTGTSCTEGRFLHLTSRRLRVMVMLASESRMPSVMSGADRCSRFDRYQEADVSDYGKAGSGPHDHFFTEF
jgi:hypothetical protein